MATAAGLFFFHEWRSHAGMDKSVERIIRRVLEEARAKGRDHITQTELAVEAVRNARPDMTASEILAVVRLMQRQ
jgi:hypothetical protein